MKKYSFFEIISFFINFFYLFFVIIFIIFGRFIDGSLGYSFFSIFYNYFFLQVFAFFPLSIILGTISTVRAVRNKNLKEKKLVTIGMIIGIITIGIVYIGLSSSM